MKTILHMIDTTGPGGAETVFLELIKASRDAGYNTIALIRGPGWVQTQLESLQINFFVIDCKGSFNIGYLIKLLRLIGTNKVDVIQTHLLGSAIYGSLAGILTSRTVISTFHGSVDISPKERFKHLKLFTIRLGCAALISVTDSVNKLLISQPIIRKDRVRTIYNGIDSRLYIKHGKSLLKSDLGVGNGLLIGSVGNIRRPKNYPLALRTIKELHNLGINAHYVIAGQGSNAQIEPLNDLAQELGINQHVHILGFVSDIQSFLSGIDIFLMSSSSEGHPLALTQAMINGLPIVSTPSGVEEIITHNVDGLISKSHDAEELAKCIEHLSKSAEIRETLARQAHNTAISRYELKTMIENYMGLYRNAK